MSFAGSRVRFNFARSGLRRKSGFVTGAFRLWACFSFRFSFRLRVRMEILLVFQPYPLVSCSLGNSFLEGAVLAFFACVRSCENFDAFVDVVCRVNVEFSRLNCVYYFFFQHQVLHVTFRYHYALLTCETTKSSVVSQRINLASKLFLRLSGGNSFTKIYPISLKVYLARQFYSIRFTESLNKPLYDFSVSDFRMEQHAVDVLLLMFYRLNTLC